MNSKKHSNREYQNFLQRKVETGRADMIANMGHLNEKVEAEFAKRRAAANLRLCQYDLWHARHES